MERWIRTAVALAASFLVLPFFGCQFASIVTVEIRDFDSSGVEGVWMWRDGGNQFERATEFEIVEMAEAGGREYLNYAIRDSNGAQHSVLPAEILRDPGNPDSVQISFMMVLFDGEGSFKASTYNAFGESGLSSQSLDVTGS